MKTKLALAALLAASALAPAQAALTAHTGKFLGSVTHYNGFEGIGSSTSYPGASPYAEDGITVVYVGVATNIWTDSQILEGAYSWYPNGGSNGYTAVTFAATDAIQFAASSGWLSGGGYLQYQVLNGGSIIGTGSLGMLPVYPGIGNSDFGYYGFSGATFDEIHLQVARGTLDFNPGANEAGTYDAFSIGSAVPEASTWALMIAGAGVIGAAARRRQDAEA